MKNFITSIALLCFAGAPGYAAEPPPQTEQDKTLYAIGLLLSRSVQTFELTPTELVWVQQGFADGALTRTAAVDVAAYGPKVQELQRARLQVAAAKEKQAAASYVANELKQKGATRTPSGIVVTPLVYGGGAAPRIADQVKVHYEGRLINGTVFDSSRQRGEPANFPLTGVITCWTEALQLMKVGGKARIVCPPDLAYGERGSPPLIRPGATLVFEVELLEIVQ